VTLSIVHDIVNVIRDGAGEPIRELGPGAGGSGRAVAVKGGYNVQTITGRERRVREHRFEVLADFGSWLIRHVTGEAIQRCEILVESDQVVALLDPANRYGDRVTCALAFDASFEAWKSHIEDSPISQRAFFQLARAHGSICGERDQVLAMLSQIKVTIGSAGEEQLDANGLRKLIQGSRTTLSSIAIPQMLSLSTPIFDGVDVERELDIYLTPEVPDGQPTMIFGLDCPKMASEIRAARVDVATVLADQLGDAWLVGVGESRTEVVPVVTE
jgi:hypothetical protein